MLILWVVGPAALVVGASLALVWHRRLVVAAAELEAAATGLVDVRRAVQELRSTAGQAASSAARIRDS